LILNARVGGYNALVGPLSEILSVEALKTGQIDFKDGRIVNLTEETFEAQRNPISPE